MKSSHQGWLKEYYDIHRGDPVAAWAFHIHEVGVWVLEIFLVNLRKEVSCFQKNSTQGANKK